jgi:hypothetical protein
MPHRFSSHKKNKSILHLPPFQFFFRFPLCFFTFSFKVRIISRPSDIIVTVKLRALLFVRQEICLQETSRHCNCNAWQILVHLSTLYNAITFIFHHSMWFSEWQIRTVILKQSYGRTVVSRMVRGPTQSPIQWVPGALSLEVKRPGREADHSPLSSAEVKNAWSYNSTPWYVIMVWCLVKHRDNFTFTFIWPQPGS